MPDYRQIISWLLEIYNNYDMVTRVTSNNQSAAWELVKKKQPIRMDLSVLEEEMRHSRQKDFMEYFNSHRSLVMNKSTNKHNLPANPENPVPPIFSMQQPGLSNPQQ